MIKSAQFFAEVRLRLILTGIFRGNNHVFILRARSNRLVLSPQKTIYVHHTVIIIRSETVLERIKRFRNRYGNGYETVSKPFLPLMNSAVKFWNHHRRTWLSRPRTNGTFFWTVAGWEGSSLKRAFYRSENPFTLIVHDFCRVEVFLIGYYLAWVLVTSLMQSGPVNAIFEKYRHVSVETNQWVKSNTSF